jgi:hypothetical protein
VTLDALGGLDVLGTEQAASPMFPYVVSALCAEWDTLDPEQRDTARDLITTAISVTSSGLALSDTCQVVVPGAVDLGIAVEVKTLLRDRIRSRGDQRSGALAAVALRWLAHLAVINDNARGAVVDALSEVALKPSEPLPFRSVAAQVAGVVYDRWRDVAATECLSRLTDTSGDADAWFALGQARLADALDAADRDSCLQGLRSTIECFDYAAANGEQRPDAVMYVNAVRSVTAWATGASAEMLADYYRNAHEALDDYMLHGLGLPDQPVWLRPRFEAETAWIELVKTMDRVADHGPEDLPWYDAATAIGALADVYRTANSFHPARTDAAATADGLTDLVAPQLTAPFVKAAERLAYVARWLEEVHDPDAEAFAALVRERAEQVVPPKRLPPGGIRR